MMILLHKQYFHLLDIYMLLSLSDHTTPMGSNNSDKTQCFKVQLYLPPSTPHHHTHFPSIWYATYCLLNVTMTDILCLYPHTYKCVFIFGRDTFAHKIQRHSNALAAIKFSIYSHFAYFQLIPKATYATCNCYCHPIYYMGNMMRINRKYSVSASVKNLLCVSVKQVKW